MTIQIDPVAKPRMTQRDRWAKRPVVIRYYTFCNKLREMYTSGIGGKVELEFHVPMPKSWSKKKKLQMVGQPHTQRPDIDNFIKSVLDALCDDDSHVWSVKAEKYWSNEGKVVIE